VSAVLAQWPSYLAFLVNFSTIGAVWRSVGVELIYGEHVCPSPSPALLGSQDLL
jgi:hypothetical protein